MAMAAWDRKCSTSSASYGVNCPGWRAAIFSTPTRPSRVTSGAHSIELLTNLFAAERVGAVVIEHVGKPRRRLVLPGLPAVRLADRSRRRWPDVSIAVVAASIGSRSPIRRLRAFFQAICSATRRRAASRSSRM